jgi:hypothetical protein
LHTGALAGQSAFVLQTLQVPRTQNGAAVPQSELARHATQRSLAVSQNGVVPEQSLFERHW